VGNEERAGKSHRLMQWFRLEGTFKDHLDKIVDNFKANY